MRLLPVVTSSDPEHVTACPFVLPQTPEPVVNRSPGASEARDLSTAGELGP